MPWSADPRVRRQLKAIHARSIETFGPKVAAEHRQRLQAGMELCGSGIIKGRHIEGMPAQLSAYSPPNTGYRLIYEQKPGERNFTDVVHASCDLGKYFDARQVSSPESKPRSPVLEAYAPRRGPAQAQVQGKDREPER